MSCPQLKNHNSICFWANNIFLLKSKQYFLLIYPNSRVLKRLLRNIKKIYRMDVNQFKIGINCLEHAGITLGAEKHILLQNSLVVLQNENHFKNVYFWGVIYGLQFDYYIAFGYEKDTLLGKIFYYSLDCTNWLLLTQPQSEHIQLTPLCVSRFQGDPAVVTEVHNDAPKEENRLDRENFEEEEEEKGEQAQDEEKVIKKESKELGNKTSDKIITEGELKEEDRLGAVVHLINEEATIVPRGAIFKQPDGVTIRSMAFQGIWTGECDNMRNYQHYRVPWFSCNANLMTRDDFNYAIDFLDTIETDIPSEGWTAQLFDGDRILILTCLHWPGFVFYHLLNTQYHGFIYMGDGKRNLDIPFMQTID